MNDDIEHLFMCLLAIYVPSLVKRLLNFFGQCFWDVYLFIVES